MNEKTTAVVRFAVWQQILVPVSIALILLVLLLTLLFKNHQDSREIEQTEATARQSQAIWQSLNKESLNHLQWFAQHASQNPNMVAAMENGRRDILLAESQTRLAELRKHFGISHWYFITPDQRTFLRVHAPEIDGDLITRETLRRAVDSKQAASGLELGNTATYTLRYVTPWLHDGRLIGYIEMGMEAAWFAHQIGELLQVQTLTAVDKKYTSEGAFNNGKSALSLPGNWQDFASFVLIEQSLPNVPSALSQAWNKLFTSGKSAPFKIEEADKLWSASLIPLDDIRGRPVISMAILRDITLEKATANRQLLIAGGLASVLVVLLLWALSQRLRKIENQLKMAHESLAANEQRFLDIFSTSSDWWFWEMDANLRFSYLSDNAGQLLQQDAAAIIGRSRQELLSTSDPLEHQAMKQHLADMEAHRPFHKFEYRLKPLIGNSIWISISGVPIFDRNGEFKGYRGAGIDLTAHKEEEERRAEANEGAEAKLAVSQIFNDIERPLQERINDALQIVFNIRDLAVKRRGCVFQLMPGTKKLAVCQSCGNFPTQFLENGESVSLGHCLCGRAAASGELIVSDDCFADERHENRSPDMEVHGHYVIPLMIGRECLGILLLYTDPNPSKSPERLTALRQIGDLFALAIANERVNQARGEANRRTAIANQAKSDFLANISHEIRTPMNGVISMTEFLLSTELTAEQKEFAGVIKESSESLLMTINDILDFSKIEAGKLAIEYIDFSLFTLIEQTCSLFAPQAGAKGISLTHEVAENVHDLLHGDPFRIRQVLNNLISNSIKFTASGAVRLTIEQVARSEDAATLRFSVSDNGIGIASDKMENLFQPFSQADSSITRKYGGTGLGLSISRRLVELMGGEIGVSSVIGEGSTFWFTLSFQDSENNFSD